LATFKIFMDDATKDTSVEEIMQHLIADYSDKIAGL